MISYINKDRVLSLSLLDENQRKFYSFFFTNAKDTDKIWMLDNHNHNASNSIKVFIVQTESRVEVVGQLKEHIKADTPFEALQKILKQYALSSEKLF